MPAAGYRCPTTPRLPWSEVRGGEGLAGEAALLRREQVAAEGLGQSDSHAATCGMWSVACGPQLERALGRERVLLLFIAGLEARSI